MRLLDRYLLRELIAPFGCCLGGFLLFWIASDLFTELDSFRSRAMTLRDITDYYVATTPAFLVFITPVALLLALLYCLTNHSRHNEITAIRAAGVSLWRLCAPYFAVGFLVSLAIMALNEYWVPDSSERAEEIRNRHVTRGATASARNEERLLGFHNSGARRTWQIGLYRSETGDMVKPEIFWYENTNSGLRLRADAGAFTNGVWVFTNARLYRQFLGTNTLPELLLTTNSLAMPSFNETPELIKSEIKVREGLQRGRMRVKRADLSVAEILNYLRLHPNPSRSERAWLGTKLHGRLAAPWTPFVVVLIAVPFGAASGRRNIFVGVAGSIVICFSYFVLQQLGLATGAGGHVEPWLAAWFPNLFFGVVGFVLMARVR